MKILIVCSSWRVFGAETITLKMLEGLKERGHQLLAVTSKWTDGDFSGRLMTIGVREEVMPFGAVVASLRPKYIRWTVSCLIRLPILWWNWLRVTRQFQPDVVVFTSSKQAMLLLPWLGKQRAILVEHAELTPTTLIRWLYRRLNFKISSFVAVSHFMEAFYAKLGVPPERVVLVVNGLCAEGELETKIRNGRSHNLRMPTRIGIVGRVAPTKGVEVLLQAAGLLLQRGVKFEIKMFGRGSPEYEAELRQRIAEGNLSSVWSWVGYEPDQSQIYPAIDICVVPSISSESFGMVAVEAQAFERPVIATSLGALPETVEEGVTGFLVDPNSPGQLAERIEFLISNPGISKRMGRAGRERVVTHFSVKRMTDDFEHLFRSELSL